MRCTVALFFLMFTTYALALPVYNCDVTVEEKNSIWRKPWTKKLLLSPAFTNRVSFGQTVAEFRVNAGAALGGAINGQPNFIIRGDIWDGQFESAFHKGTVNCGTELELAYVLQFLPWRRFFTLNSEVSEGHILRSIGLSEIEYEHLCYVGDEKKALAEISQIVGVQGKLLETGSLEFSWEAEDCLRGSGAYDDWTCHEYQRNRRTRKIPDCRGSRLDRP